MKIVLFGIGIVLLLVIAFIIWRFIATILASTRLNSARADAIAPIVTAIQNDEEPPREAIEELARRLDTRSYLCRVLHDLEKHDLFPAEYATRVAIAESDMSHWLLHPNELAALPDDIVLVEEIQRDDETHPEGFSFFVFKYRTLPPHWAHEDGWLAGVAGPYWHRPPSAEHVPGAFSRFEAIDSATPEEHLCKVEQSLMQNL